MLDALILLIAAAGAQATDPLTPARQGKIQCVGPNKANKTCKGTSTYTVHADGSYESVTIAMINPVPLITMEVRSKGKIEGNQLCGPLLKSDYEKATFQMDGKPTDDATATMIRTQVAAAIAPMDGKKGCATETPEGDVIALNVTLDGEAKPELSQKAIWVSPSEGYKLGQ